MRRSTANTLHSHNPNEALINLTGTGCPTARRSHCTQADLSQLRRSSHLRPIRTKNTNLENNSSKPNQVDLDSIIELINALKHNETEPPPSQTSSLIAFPKTPEKPDQTKPPHTTNHLPKSPTISAKPRRRLNHYHTLNFENQPPSITSEPKQNKTKSTLLSGLACLMIGALASWILASNNLSSQPLTIQTETQSPPPSASTEIRTESQMLREAEAVAHAFFESTSKTEILNYVREPKLTNFQMKGRFQDLTFQQLGPVTNFELLAFKTDQEQPRFLFSVSTKESWEKKYLCIADDGDGFRVDWQSFIGYSELPWSEISKTSPEETTLIRCLCKPASYYNHLYPETDWQCFELTNPNENITLYAYTKLNSPQNDQLLKLYSSSRRSHLEAFTTTLNVSTSPKSEPSQVKILGTPIQGWVY